MIQTSRKHVILYEYKSRECSHDDLYPSNLFQHDFKPTRMAKSVWNSFQILEWVQINLKVLCEQSHSWRTSTSQIIICSPNII